MYSISPSFISFHPIRFLSFPSCIRPGSQSVSHSVHKSIHGSSFNSFDCISLHLTSFEFIEFRFNSFQFISAHSITPSIHPSIHPFIHWFHSSINSLASFTHFNHSFFHSTFHSILHSCIRSFLNLMSLHCLPPVIQSVVDSEIRSFHSFHFFHSFILSFIHSFHAFIHFFRSLIRSFKNVFHFISFRPVALLSFPFIPIPFHCLAFSFQSVVHPLIQARTHAKSTERERERKREKEKQKEIRRASLRDCVPRSRTCGLEASPAGAHRGSSSHSRSRADARSPGQGSSEMDLRRDARELLQNLKDPVVKLLNHIPQGAVWTA